MEKLWITLPAMSPDYSGVCSAMFDLGGMSVIHDASGCMGNYSGYDEPRWYGAQTQAYSSGLREIDAVLGRDDKLIDNILKAGKDTKPSIYTVVGSPVPMIIGTDMEGIATEIEARSGVPAFGFDTNGLGLYNAGVSMAMRALVERFTKPAEPIPNAVNILGSNAIDFSANENADDLADALTKRGYTIVGRMMMGASLEQIERLATASANLVVSEAGYETARLLYEKFGTPYVVGNPLADEADVFDALEKTLADRENRVIKDAAKKGGILIVGEQVMGNSLRRAILNRDKDAAVTVGTLCGLRKEIADENDVDVPGEETLIKLITSGDYRVLVGDPLFADLIAEEDGVELVELPHIALSSKLYWHDAPRFFGEEMTTLIDRALQCAA